MSDLLLDIVSDRNVMY